MSSDKLPILAKVLDKVKDTAKIAVYWGDSPPAEVAEVGWEKELYNCALYFGVLVMYMRIFCVQYYSTYIY